MDTATLPRLITPVDSVQMLVDAWALMTGRYRGCCLIRDDGVTTVFANRALSFFNLSILDLPLTGTDDFHDALAVARSRASASAHPSFLALCGEWAPDGWEDVAADAGWLRSLSMWGMATDRLLPTRRPEPALEFRLVCEQVTALDVGLVNAFAYDMPPQAFDCLGEMELWEGGAFGIVGYDEDRPVTSASAFVLPNAIYVAMVASAPGLHGRGYGEAAMRRAIAEAEQAAGRRRIWLHATEAGFPLYRSMGFQCGPALVLFHLPAG